MSVYTKKGDRGKTSIIGSKKRISKDSSVVETLGSLDEVSSYLGVVSSHIKSESTRKKIIKIQNSMFSINAMVAGSKIVFQKNETDWIEAEIDRMEKKLPKLIDFVLPAGTILAAKIMYVRTLVRKAERKYTSLPVKFKNKNVQKYLNRLSDYFFILFRFELHRKGVGEVIWEKG